MRTRFVREHVWPVATLFALSALVATGCDEGDAPSAGSSVDSPVNFADAVETVQPAVFHIVQPRRGDATDAGSASDSATRKSRSLGSGIIISKTGEAITNAHVVRPDGETTPTNLKARLHDGREFHIQLEGFDPHTDLALLNLESDAPFPTAPLGDSQKARVGDWVITLGYPLGYSSTATAGIVSGMGRTELPLDARDVTYQNFIQTDASVHRGGSGGALVNADAEVVGMTTATVDDAPGLSFAIPSRVITRLLPELRSFGRVTKTWIGLFVDPVPQKVREELELPPNRGVLIKRIFEDGPAVGSGIQPGDILMELDGTPVHSVQQIAHVAGRLGLGRQVDIVVKRGLSRRTFQIPTVPHPQVSAPPDWKSELQPE